MTALRAAVAVVLAAAPCAAAGAKTFGIQRSFYGEGGGAAPPPNMTGESGQYMENLPRQDAEQQRKAPAAPAKTQPAPESRQTAAAQPPRVAPAAQVVTDTTAKPVARQGALLPRDPAQRRLEERSAQPAADRLTDAVADPKPEPKAQRYSLWDDMGKPVEMTTAKLADQGLEDAEQAARAEYDRRILGVEDAVGVGALKDAPASLAPGAAAAPAAANELFVAVDLAAAPADLKDAVAGLTQVAGFRADARFPPQANAFSASPSASVRGWLPADRVGEAARAPRVLRLEIERGGPAREPQSAAVSSLLVGIRMPAQASAGETLQRVVGELKASARFKWTRTIGFQAVPNSKELALVIAGEVPVTRIPRLLEHPAVLKIAPAPVEREERPAPKPSRAAQFAQYVRDQSPWLLILTLLVLLPPAGGVLARLARTFIPYH